MTYSVETTKRFDKEFRKLDRYTQKMISAWIKKHIEGCDDPRSIGKPLSGDRKGTWRYRIGDYRIICIIQDDKMIVIALTVGHRREVYL